MRMLIVPAAPPSTMFADGVFETSSFENNSGGNMSSGTSRFAAGAFLSGRGDRNRCIVQKHAA